MLVFGTEANIDRLAESPYWIMDGTFKVSPNLFYQVYTIHGFVGDVRFGQTFSLVYAILTSSKSSIYKELLKVSP